MLFFNIITMSIVPLTNKPNSGKARPPSVDTIIKQISVAMAP